MLSIHHHPANLLQPEWIAILRGDATLAEKQKRLTARQLALLQKEKWFLALAPKCYGGLQWTLPQIVAFEEAIGWADGSAGWVFTLCSGAGWFGGFLEEGFAGEIFSPSNACLAGSGAATGVAEMLPDGKYVVNGVWNYASGAPDATIFTTNCRIQKEGKQLLDANGNPVIAPFCFKAGEVELWQTWNEIGLVASAGHSFAVNNITVSTNRKFAIEAACRKVDAPLYRFPFIHLAEATIAANFAGMAIHFMEEWETIARQKTARNGEKIWDSERVRNRYANAVTRLDAHRRALSIAVDDAWNLIQDTDADSFPAISDAAQALAAATRAIVNELFPYCGLSAVKLDTAIGRCWRDFQTGSQHALFMPIL